MSPRALVWLLMTAATAFAAVNVGAGALYLVALSLLVFGLVAFGSAWRAGDALDFEPDLPVRAMAGSEVRVSLDVRARRDGGPLLALVSDPGATWRRMWLPRLLPAEPVLPPLTRGERARVVLTCSWPRRGRHPIAPRALQAPAWGLGAWLHPVALPGTLLVHPRVELLGRVPRVDPGGTGQNRAGSRPQVTSLASASSEQIRGVRPYRTGDSPRMVHARATARTGEVRVRELDREVSRGSGGWRVVLDGGLSEEAFERALEVLASLATWCASTGRNLEVWTPHRLAWPTSGRLDEQLDALAEAGRLEVGWTFSEVWPWPPGAVLTTREVAPPAGLWLHVGAGTPPREALPCGPGQALAEVLHEHLN